MHRSIITGNTIKATFDKDALAEIHASSNNIDKLQSLIAKCYKNIHSVQYKKFDIHNYVCCIDWAKYYCQPYVPIQSERKTSRHLDERIFMIAETHDRQKTKRNIQRIKKKSSNTRYKQSRKARKKGSKIKGSNKQKYKN
ncbi:unnamed protein product [Rhizophagus irregularis]|nr:unnamed protein product [Rhizophagus irregularis]